MPTRTITISSESGVWRVASGLSKPHAFASRNAALAAALGAAGSGQSDLQEVEIHILAGESMQAETMSIAAMPGALRLGRL